MKNRKNFRGFAPIIILILLVLIAGGAYYFGTLKNKTIPTPITSSNPVASPTADPTVNWKMYTGAKYSFKYPNDWINENSKATISLHSPDEKSSLSLDINVKRPSLETCEQILKAENINLQGVVANKTLFTGVNSDMCGNVSTNRHVVVIITNSDNTVDTLAYRYVADANVTKTETMFDQILSTFQFTK